jgi:hypothetical protein
MTCPRAQETHDDVREGRGTRSAHLLLLSRAHGLSLSIFNFALLSGGSLLIILPQRGRDVLPEPSSDTREHAR